MGIDLRLIAKASPRRILLPEVEDERIVEAARVLESEALVEPILLDAAASRDRCFLAGHSCMLQRFSTRSFHLPLIV